jgi:hypothetical protein
MDLEFTGLRQDTTIISIALIEEYNGKTFYAECTDYDRSQVDTWIQENVIDNCKWLPPGENMKPFFFTNGQKTECCGPTSFVAMHLREWVMSLGGPIHMVSDVCHYDMVLFCSLFGGAMKLPGTIAPVCYDINQDIARYYNTNGVAAFNMNREEILGIKTETKHNSMWDAQVVKQIYEMMNPRRIA